MRSNKKFAFILLAVLALSIAVPMVHATSVVVNGVVRDSKGDPVQGATVGLYKTPDPPPPGFFIMIPWPIATTTTDSSGAFTFSQDLTYGEEYYVLATKTDYKSSSVAWTVYSRFILKVISWNPVVTINHYPTVNHHGPYVGQATVPINFNSFGSEDPDGTIASYLWSFGDGDTSTEANPTHAYASNGNYDVRLTITDNSGDSKYLDTYANIGNAPISPIAVANGPYSGRAPDEIAFSSAGSYDPDGSITAYHWEFGDGESSSASNPTHAYGEGGSYNVTLTVMDNQGMSGVDTTICEVAPPPVPPVAVANGPYSGRATEEVQFNSSGSDDPDGALDAFLWDFGDGETSNESDPIHIYTAVGDYEVTLTVTDNEGLTHADVTSCSVGAAPVNPVAVINGPYSGRATEAISFSSAGSNDPDGTIASYLWDFGDGETSTEANPTHAYATMNDYTVSLTVTDNEGLTHTETVACSVAAAPQAPTAYVNGPYAGTETEEIAFSSDGTNDPDGTITAYLWDFGDGETSTQPNPKHTYATADAYTVTLTVTDNDGLTDADSTAVTVEAKAGLPLLEIGAVVVIAAAAAAYYFLVMKKKPEEKPPRASSLRVKVDPSELPADDKSTATVTVELLDDTGAPIGAEGSIQVNVTSSLGKVNGPATIRAGATKGTTSITADANTGTASVKAEATGLVSGSASISFTESRRYCMHCGSKMAVTDSICPKCKQSPPSGVDVKACPNCGEVIPNVAKYCSECGASQPENEE